MYGNFMLEEELFMAALYFKMKTTFMIMTMPSSRINVHFGTPSCDLFLTCGGKINS
jgi:hypothetical protein